MRDLNQTEEERAAKYERARKRVKEIKKFYSGLLSYVFVIGGLAGLNYYLDEWRHPWFLWAAFGWGIGITIAAFKLFVKNPFLNKGWENRKIREFMDKDH